MVGFENISLPQFKPVGYRVNVTRATTSSGDLFIFGHQINVVFGEPIDNLEGACNSFLSLSKRGEAIEFSGLPTAADCWRVRRWSSHPKAV